MLLSDITTEIKGLSDVELTSILRLIRAKKQTYNRPLAFVQELMGFHVMGRIDDLFSYQMKVSEDLVNRYGLLHGGFTTAFLDTAMAETAFQIDHTMSRALTLNITVNFIKPGLLNDTLTADVQVTQNSHAIMMFQATVRNERDIVLATSEAHFYKQQSQLQTRGDTVSH